MNSHGVCPNCGNPTDSDARYCEHCAIDLIEFRQRAQAAEAVAKESAESHEAKYLKKRYWDAYIVARTTVSVGAGIKIVGLVLGLIIFLAFFMFANSQVRYARDAQFIGVIVGGVWGGLVWVTFYILGVLVSAQGQILKASLDGAVNSSPFLTNEQRAKIMSL
jgi:hypothetical protein